MKSRSSQRKVSLKRLENQGFWDFYIANKEDLDYIIDASCHRFKSIVPTEDMRLDILIDLYDNGILDRYDSTKAGLNTYITEWIRGYAKNLAAKECRDLFENTDAAEKRKAKEQDDRPQRVREYSWQVYDSELNGGVGASLNLSSSDDMIEKELDSDYLMKLGFMLTGSYRTLFNMLLEDMTSGEMAKVMQISRQGISWRCDVMKEQLQDFARDEVRRRFINRAPNRHERKVQVTREAWIA